jgi:hypothetical protein
LQFFPPLLGFIEQQSSCFASYNFVVNLELKALKHPLLFLGMNELNLCLIFLHAQVFLVLCFGDDIVDIHG